MNGLPDQSPELLALADALAGIPAPCMTATDPDLWFSDDAAAFRGCQQCHARQECATYADSIDARFGVWAGHDYETRTTTVRKSA
jgi:WhiB family transcriptional regulator, redox-sensing transcriptional regulator